MGSLLSCTSSPSGSPVNFRQPSWPSTARGKSKRPVQPTWLSLTSGKSSPSSSTLTSSHSSPDPASHQSQEPPGETGTFRSVLTLSRQPSGGNSRPLQPSLTAVSLPQSSRTTEPLQPQAAVYIISLNVSGSAETHEPSPSPSPRHQVLDTHRKKTLESSRSDSLQELISANTRHFSPVWRGRRPSLDFSRSARPLQSTLFRSAASSLEVCGPEGIHGSTWTSRYVDGLGQAGSAERFDVSVTTHSPQCRQASSWKFWRKMSTKRPDRKTRWSAKNAAGVGNVKVTDGVKPRDLDLGDEAGVVTEAAPATSGSLPDVLDKAVLTRSISLKAPPKPPRLFLCRSSSLNQYQPRSAEPASFYRPVDSEPGLREKAEVDEEPIYVNAAFGAALKSGLSGNDRIIPPSLHNHSQHHHVSYRESQRQKTGPRHSKDEGLTLMPSEVRERSGRVRDTPGGGQRGAGEARETLEESRQKAREARESAGDDRRLLAWDYRGRPTDTVPRPPRLSSSSLSLSNIYYSLPHRPKTRQRVLSSHLMPHGPRPRGRTRSVDQPEQRHQTILHSVLDLVCQRWDPFPLLDPLHAAGVLTAMDLQAFRGHPDRKLICENVLNAVGNGDYSVFLAFLEVLRGAGSQRDILHVLQAMKDMDSVIHDLPGPPQEEEEDEEDQILAEEKILSFEVGYLAPDGVSLKPVVELERVRSGERRTLPRTPQGSMPMPDPCSQPGGPGEGGSSPPSACVTGHVMINVCITGHSLSGSRALALAQVLRTQDCIVELRIGKTQLCSADVAALCGALRHNSTLASLDLRLNSLSHVGASAIASVLSHTQVLQQLNLSSTGLEVAGCRDVLAAVTLNRTLAELDLSFLNVGDSVCDAVRDVLRANGALRRLRLRSNNFSSVGIAIIAEGLHRNRSLLELDLSRNILGDGGIEALARYIPESALTEISLENCNVTCAACGVLSQMIISSKRLRVLDLSVNPLGDEGVQGLAAALERSSVLHSLALNMCGVSNDGFSALLDVLEKNTSIWLLKLCYNLLGRQHLNPAATSDNLRYRLRIVTSSKPKLKILLWGNSFSDLEADDRGSRRYSSLR